MSSPKRGEIIKAKSQLKSKLTSKNSLGGNGANIKYSTSINLINRIKPSFISQNVGPKLKSDKENTICNEKELNSFIINKISNINKNGHFLSLKKKSLITPTNLVNSVKKPKPINQKLNRLKDNQGLITQDKNRNQLINTNQQMGVIEEDINKISSPLAADTNCKCNKLFDDNQRTCKSESSNKTQTLSCLKGLNKYLLSKLNTFSDSDSFADSFTISSVPSVKNKEKGVYIAELTEVSSLLETTRPDNKNLSIPDFPRIINSLAKNDFKNRKLKNKVNFADEEFILFEI